MTSVKESWNRLRALARRHTIERGLDDEIRFHVDQQTEKNQRAGMSPDEARRQALVSFGGTERAKESAREEMRAMLIEDTLRDLRYGLRSLRRNPLFAIAVLTTLAIGIGANTAIFSVVNGVLIAPLPYPDSARLISMAHSETLGSAPFLYYTEREENRTLEGVGAYNTGTASITGRGEPEQVQRLTMTSEVLPILGIPPLLGRHFSVSDDAPGSPNTMVLSWGYWQRRFGGDPSAVGQRLTMDGQPWTIIGIMPQSFRFLDRTVDVMIPFRLGRSQVRAGTFFLARIARLKSDVTLEQATADVRRMIPIAIDRFPAIPGFTREQMLSARLAPRLRPLKQTVVGDV